MTHPQQIYNKERVSLNIVRLKKAGKNFEVILSDPDAALKLRRGGSNDSIKIDDILKAPEVYSNARHAEKASESDLKATFGTDNYSEVARTIITTGDFQLTADQKRDVLDEKRNKIIEYIHLNASDPKTKLPHPKKRIELAMEQAKINVNMYESTTSQTEEIVKKIRAIIPLSFEKVGLRITVPATNASKAYATIKSRFNIVRDAWQNDGSVMVELEVQAGQKQTVFNLVNSLTRGDATITEIKNN